MATVELKYPIETERFFIDENLISLLNELMIESKENIENINNTIQSMLVVLDDTELLAHKSTMILMVQLVKLINCIIPKIK